MLAWQTRLGKRKILSLSLSLISPVASPWRSFHDNVLPLARQHRSSSSVVSAEMMIASGRAVRSYLADVIARPFMRMLGSTSAVPVVMLISEGLLTGRVEQPGEGTVETNPDLHVIVLALRLDICKFLFSFVIHQYSPIIS